MDRYEVEAFNTATASTNRIHDDAVARDLGFRGGLVPGVDVFAYLSHVPAARWGRSWLEHGGITARFDKPVYDGDTVGVVAAPSGGALDLALSDPAGVVCATARAHRDPPAPPPVDAIPVRPVAPEPPAASPEVFAAFPDGVLGTLEYGFHVEQAGAYLASVRETLPLYAAEGVAHPGWLLRMANWALSYNVRLGPWIHVGSDLRLHGVIEDGQSISVRSRVTGVTDRKGHGFVDLDVLYVVDGTRVAASCAHTAIYQPRGLRTA
jgi:acyl dehydratase